MLRFALVGNPNSGKTTLFNSLTGSTAHVGNWPGVTVDKKEGIYKKSSEPVDIIDLPGIYSLSPYTPEEVISRNYILDEKPDCIINIVDATNLERNLYLTTQLLETDVPIVVALNMIDVIRKRGDEINVELLSKKIGVPVVAIGVPTVVDVISIFNDTLDFVASTKEEAKLEYNEYDVKEALSESNLDFMVTPKEIDEVMNMLSDVISKGINTSIHNLNAY